jgi:hypothetical protein
MAPRFNLVHAISTVEFQRPTVKVRPDTPIQVIGRVGAHTTRVRQSHEGLTGHVAPNGDPVSGHFQRRSRTAQT